MDTAPVITSLVRYMFERPDRYAKCFSLSDGKELSVIETGRKVSDEPVLYRGTVVEADGLRQKVTAAIFEDSRSWHEWQRANGDRAEEIGLVMVADENDDIGRYAAKDILCVRCEIPLILFERFSAMIASNGKLCAEYLMKMERLTRSGILYRMALERLEDKHDVFAEAYEEMGADWYSAYLFMLFYTVMIHNRRNRKFFVKLLNEIGYNTVLQSLTKVEDVEALLFGTAGMFHLCPRHDKYTGSLQARYAELKRLYAIKEMDGALWDYSRAKSENNIYMVVAQLAAVIFNSRDAMERLGDKPALEDFYRMILVEPSEYWSRHDTLSGAESEYPHSKRLMSIARRERFVINGFIPFMLFYNKVHERQDDNERLIEILESLEAERNEIIKKWVNDGLPVDNAMLSQAVLQVEKLYCTGMRCTECLIGRRMLD